MRNRIEGVYERVIECATEEFLEKGYTDASLRAIAEKAGTSTNSIYVRFKDKEGLFAAIVEPVSEEFLSRCLDIQKTFHRFDKETQRREVGTYSGNAMLDMIDYIYDQLVGYAARTCFYNMALSVSHKATFSILKAIRQKILKKLPKLPLGTVMDMSSGKMKQIIVDQVDGMETTLAHLFPEMTANVAAPILILVYLFVLDWRMALLSLVTIPVGMVFMMSVMGNYSRDYEGL